MSSMETLQAVSEAVRQEETARVIGAAKLAEDLKPYEELKVRAVIAALKDGHTVTNVARAYTVSGKTPNRNEIHAIKKKYMEESEVLPEYPFEWVVREVETKNGLKVYYDIHADLHEFGPDEITGEYQWNLDLITGEPTPVITEQDPYPVSKFYRNALKRWVMMNPKPGS